MKIDIHCKLPELKMIDIDSFTVNTLNQSWVVSLLDNYFNHSKVLDFWNNHKCLKYFKDSLEIMDFSMRENIIVCIDDESFEYDRKDLQLIFDLIKENHAYLLNNIVFIFKTKELFNIAKKNNIKCVLFPYFDIMEDLISFNKLKKYPNNKVNQHKPFFSLNGTYNHIRNFLITTLNKYDLIEYGYVTCNFRDKVPRYILKKITIDDFAENVYFKDKNAPCDRIYHEYDNLPCTLNFKNYFYISEQIPGSISLGVESCASEDIKMSLRSPSDKTFLPFICKRLPLIIGDYEKIEVLKDEGFDVFDDILDHSYSKISNDNYEKKVVECIEKNYNLLKENNLLLNSEINSRLDKNQEIIMNHWFINKINIFIQDIKNQLEQYV